MIDNSGTVVYHNGELELDIYLNEETVWVTQKQLSLLFDVEVHTINYHIKNIFKQIELEKDSTIRNIRILQKEGNREVSRDVEHYNLDMVISVGYRVNSNKATKFRQWATKVLINYIYTGYTINSEKITVDRFINLEKEVNQLKNEMNDVDILATSNKIEMNQGIFYNGQIYDAYVLINDMIKSAKKEVVLIDNYIDESICFQQDKYKISDG